MNKLTKASLASGCGLVLLLGGGSTLSYWTDSTTAAPAVIQAGQLDLGSSATTVWQLARDVDGNGTLDGPAAAFVPGTDQIVPGDVVLFTQTLPVTLAGENIKADFAATVNLVADSANAEDVELAKFITQNATVTIVEATGFTVDQTGKRITGEGTGKVDVTGRIVFPWGSSGAENAAMLGAMRFTVDYTLTQAS